MHKITRYR